VARPAPAPAARPAPVTVARPTTPSATVRTQPAQTQPSAAPAARVREDAAIAAARAKTLENAKKQDQEAARLRAQQTAINNKRDQDAAAVRAQQAAINKKQNEDAARRAAATRSGPSISSGPAAGYNTSSSNSVTIGSDRRTGGATPADRAAMDKIQADAKKLREQKQKPAN
jgi:hypothetical protein